MLPRATIDRQANERRALAADARWLVPALTVPAIVGGLALALPGALVLPALCLILLVAGFSLAALEQSRGRSGPEALKRRDIAAVLVFLGFAAAILTDGQDALRVLGEIEAALSRRAPAPG